MQPYGRRRRVHKLHDADRCDICAENGFNKKSERQRNKKDMQIYMHMPFTRYNHVESERVDS